MTRILLVDDDRLFRQMESNLLGWKGYTIEEASDGNQALAMVRDNPPDLILLDLYLPTTSGAEVCEQIKADPALQHIPIIMVTASNLTADIRKSVEAGCDDYLTKPLDDASLLQKVESILGVETKRHFRRISASMQVSFENFKGIFFEYARDISRSGVFIEMAEPLEIGTRLRLSFALPTHDKTITAFGRVVRSTEAHTDQRPGIGVAFIHIDKESAAVIDQLPTVPPSNQPSAVLGHLRIRPEPFSLPPDSPSRAPFVAADSTYLHQSFEDIHDNQLRLSAALSSCEGLLEAQNPDQLLNTLRQILGSLLGASSFGVFLHNPADNNLVRVLGHKIPDPLNLTLPTTDLDAPEALQSKASTALRDLEQNPVGLIAIFEFTDARKAINASFTSLLQLIGRHAYTALKRTVSEKLSGPLSGEEIARALK